jgi:hypothetical protein
MGYTIYKKRSVESIRYLLFLQLKCENSTNFIGCLNIQTRQLNILDFSLKLPIESITGFDEGNLIIQTEWGHSRKTYIYKIPFG